MLYSFDDHAIGTTEDLESGFSDRLIERPPELAQSGWHNFAASTCRALNQQVQNTLIVRCASADVRDTVEQVITGATGIRFDGRQTEFYDNYTDAVRYYSPAKGLVEVIAEEVEVNGTQ